jgi:MFS family permease
VVNIEQPTNFWGAKYVAGVRQCAPARLKECRTRLKVPHMLGSHTLPTGPSLAPLSDAQMLVLGFPLGFFSAGIPASLGALFNELYPSGVRGTGVGFCYNFGRVIAASFPPPVGRLSETIGFGSAIGIVATSAYSIVVVAVLMLPETKGKKLSAADRVLVAPALAEGSTA